MAGRRRKSKSLFNDNAAPSPLTDSEWASVVDAMSLTPRQAEITGLILRGNCDKQIASRLTIGLPTVRTHLRQLFALHRVDSRVQLVLRVFEIARNPRQIRPSSQVISRK